jgi:hypothetical protein
MNFFFDNNMSPRIAAMIAGLVGDEHVIRHIRTDPRFEHNTEDDVWIPALAQDTARWSVLTGDCEMLKNPVIIAQLRQSKMIFFGMDDNWTRGNSENSQAWKLVKVWPDIVARASREGPAFYEIQTGNNRPCVQEMQYSRRARRRKFQ